MQNKKSKMFFQRAHVYQKQLTNRCTIIKTYIDLVGFFAFFIIVVRAIDVYQANSFSISKEGFLQFTNGLAYMMSSSCFEPLMSVNIQPLPYGSCTIVLNSTFCNFVKQSKKNLSEKTDDLLLFSKQTLVAKKQKGRRRESQKKIKKGEV